MKTIQCLPANQNTLTSVIASKSFSVSYLDENGRKLRGLVTQLSDEDYEVFVPEKEVIIHCTKDADGGLICKLNSRRNVPWVDGISQAITEKLSKKY